jgi:iron-sulfur cluster assembly protein
MSLAADQTVSSMDESGRARLGADHREEHAVFTMTPKAREVVRRVTSHPRVGKSSGLRIASQGPATDALGVRTAAGPQHGDEVIERDGARVFLDQRAVPRVRGRLLDAVTEETGVVRFVVRAGR